MIFSCKQETKNSMPENYLSKTEIDSFKYKIIRYIERLPKFATESTKFHAQFDDDYKKSVPDLDLLYYYKNKENTIYFAISKIAPSIKLKKTATVGRLKINEKDSIIFYEEAFRTWKMEPKELEEKTQVLFSKYINNENLTEFYTINSIPEYYIEFPDEFTSFDTLSRSWKTIKK